MHGSSCRAEVMQSAAPVQDAFFITSTNNNSFINSFIKVKVNYNKIDFYIIFYLIYNVIGLIFIQNFITSKKIMSYYYNKRFSPFIAFKISY